MANVQYDITVDAGYPVTATFTYLVNGAVVTGFGYWNATLQVRKNPYLTDAPLINKSLQVDGTTGDVTLALTPAETTLLKWGYFIYGIELQDDAFNPIVELAVGNLTVNPAVALVPPVGP
jgi:hypothetical protein